MTGKAACKVCNAPNRDAIEALGREALDGTRSWRSCADPAKGGFDGLNHTSLKNHMEKHFVSETQREIEDEWKSMVGETIEELKLKMAQVAPELRGYYVVMVQNLQGLLDTKPSQENLLKAMKFLQEATGMKQQQQLLLDYLKAFKSAPKPRAVESASEVVEELPEAEVVESG